ncbi:ABC transporter permease [Pseudonocardia oroxyli]|uniref:FtsX-like permease family protein n=1 Tax=Pseudonocardia oroxyli TaxID=366584 RepID=A0A1G7VN74_PSEOR|nr:ABC transporter permease [Pseudonocardia oroxyli]SDG60350.1 FtsX-like permease family protein [Pseudonocardia oroxyli]
MRTREGRGRLSSGGPILVARAVLRERWWALLALGVVFGLVGGLVPAAGAVAERTATAYTRLVEAVHLDDARTIVPADVPEVVAEVPTMPGAAAAWTPEAWIVQLDGSPVRFSSLIAGTPPGDLVAPVLVAGRAPDPAAPDEVVVSERSAETGVSLGAVLPVTMLTLDNVADFAVGFTAAGPRTTLRVVGVARMPSWGNALPDVVGGPGFAAAHAGTGIGHAVYVRFDDTPDAAARFTEAFTAAVARHPSVVSDYLAPALETPRTTPDQAVVAAERALLVGIGLFALVVGLGAVQVLGLGLLRTGAAARPARSVEAALGMTLGQSLGARALAAFPAAVVAGVLAAGVVIAAGTLEPLGSQARFEPAPGFRPQWALAAVGGPALTATFVLVAVLTAALTWRTSAAEEPGPAPRRSLVRRWPALLLGSRLAGAGGRRGLPPAVTVLAATAAVAGIVATVTVGASLDRLVEEPRRWAGGADAVLVDAREPDVARLVDDPRVQSLALSETSYAREPDGGLLGIAAQTVRKGTPPVELVSGRLPAAPDEIAVNPRLAAQHQLAVGDVLPLVAPDGTPRAMTVVGAVVVAREDYGELGQDLLATPDGLAAVAVPRALPLLTAHVFAVPGAGAGLAAELAAELELSPTATPDAVRNLADLTRLPGILTLVLVVVAGTGMVHSLLVGARRLAREMAVFTVLGATPGQVRTTLAVLAVATAVPAVLLGVPLGVGVARLFWWEVATAVGVGGDIAVPVGALALVVAAVPLGAVLVTTIPALRLRRLPATASLGAW